MKFSRRALLAATAGMAAFRKTAITQAPLAPADPSKVPGRPPSVLGQRSPFEKPQRLPQGAAVSRTPLQDLCGTITPADMHFERHHAGVPQVDPHSYSLLIHGMVERPTLFTLADLKRFPSVSRICFLECSGNLNRLAPSETTPQQLAGLTSQSEWSGTDGSKNWAPARLQEPVLPKAHTRFRYLWNWMGDEAVIMSRAVDETGYVQPTRAELLAARGAGSIPYHLNPITGWVVRADGTVVYRQEAWG